MTHARRWWIENNYCEDTMTAIICLHIWYSCTIMLQFLKMASKVVPQENPPLFCRWRGFLNILHFSPQNDAKDAIFRIMKVNCYYLSAPGRTRTYLPSKCCIFHLKRTNVEEYRGEFSYVDICTCLWLGAFNNAEENPPTLFLYDSSFSSGKLSHMMKDSSFMLEN